MNDVSWSIVVVILLLVIVVLTSVIDVKWSAQKPMITELITNCEKDLPRTQHCHLIAVPVEGGE